MKALLQSSGIDFGSCSTIVQQRLRLPHFLKGAGIRLQSFRRHLDYLGGLAQGLPPLLDKHDKTGNISTVGRLNSHSLVSLFGESSFDLDCTTPWKHLLDQHPTTSFATAIRDCHAALTNAYDTASAPVNPTATTTILVESLGCGPKGNLLISPTSTLTKELEEHQYSMLEQFVFSLPDSSQIPIMEQLAMINCDHYSTAIFKALPRKGTFFTDRQFTECICTVMGLPSPTFAPLQDTILDLVKPSLWIHMEMA